MNISTIVIVTFNSSHLIENALKSLASYETLVLDNASTDSTIERIIDKHPNVKTVNNKINIGYGRAANTAFELIDTPYALLLNPDVGIDIKQLDKLLALPEGLDNDWLYIAPNTGHVVTELDMPPSNTLARITHATGCALLFNLENFNKLGGFDENIFLYYEEMDLSIRAHEAGLKMYYAEDIHFPHNSKKSVADDEKLECTRNWHFQWSSLYYKKKHGLWGYFLEGIVINLLVSPIKQLFAEEDRSERYRVKRKATIAFIKGKPAFLNDGHPYIPD